MSKEESMFSARDLTRAGTSPPAYEEAGSQELRLTPNFLWGTATSAYQIEGGCAQDGKGKSIWDTYAHLEPSRTNGENADVACDHYNRMPEDVELMSSLNVDAYRFSISWSRVIPLGGRNDPVNEKGIAFYQSLINKLLAHGIKPLVTLYHWDAPQALYDRYGAFLNTKEFRADFERYSRLCFTRFGDRVKQWITFNEPYIISIFGHLNGTLAPGHCRQLGNDTKNEPWTVGHTIIVSHAAVVQQYVAEFQQMQKGEISITLNGHFYEPYDAQNPQDIKAAETRMIFYIGWFADPIFLGQDYPIEMRKYLGSRLPQFTNDEQALIEKAASHNAFYGMNHYSTKYARALPEPPEHDDWTGNIQESAVNSEGKEIGPASSLAWLRVAPHGFRSMLNWAWSRYKLPILITENGCPCPGEEDLAVALQDQFRQNYLGLYLDSISRAIFEDGVKVTGYCVWSLMDNFEWSAGYGPRYGIVHVDYDTLKRTPKGSALYLKDTFTRRRRVLRS